MVADQNDRETKFRDRVLAGIETWSSERSPIVLWDIDDTLGKVLTGPDGSVWKTRPCVPELSQMISEQFPKIRHGILSDRLVPEIMTMLSGEAPLGDDIIRRVEQLVDAALVFTANEAVFWNDPNLLNRYNAMKSSFRARVGVYRKFAVLGQLRETGLNVHLVDDLPLDEEIPGGCPFALYVGDLRPKF